MLNIFERFEKSAEGRRITENQKRSAPATAHEATQYLMEKHLGLEEPHHGDIDLEKFMPDDDKEWIDKAHSAEMPTKRVEKEALTALEDKRVKLAAYFFQEDIVKHIDAIDDKAFNIQMNRLRGNMDDNLPGGMMQWNRCHNAFVEDAVKSIDARIGNGLSYTRAESLKEILKEVFLGVEMSKI